VHRGVLVQVVKVLLVVGASIVGGPGVSDGISVEVEHVHDTDSGNTNSEGIGALVHAGTKKRNQAMSLRFNDACYEVWGLDAYATSKPPLDPP
jgi:hypothetical protein